MPKQKRDRGHFITKLQRRKRSSYRVPKSVKGIGKLKKSYFDPRISGKLSLTHQMAPIFFKNKPVLAKDIKKFNQIAWSRFLKNPKYGSVDFKPLSKSEILILLQHFSPGWHSSSVHKKYDYANQNSVKKIKSALNRWRGIKAGKNTNSYRNRQMNGSLSMVLQGATNKKTLRRYLKGNK